MASHENVKLRNIYKHVMCNISHILTPPPLRLMITNFDVEIMCQ